MSDFSFTEDYLKIKTLDMHTGGEPLRIVLEGYPDFEGRRMLDIRRELALHHDHLRKAIMWEPRGHADMYGLLKVPAERTDSDFGVIFMHNEGYSTMCGHATIAIAKAAVMLGWVATTAPVTTIKIDAPCGQLTAYVAHAGQEVQAVSFENVPSFYVGTYELEVPEIGRLTYDLAYGGAFYAYVDTQQLGLRVTSEYYPEIIRYGKLIKHLVMETNQEVVHPYETDLSFLYGTIFIDDPVIPGHHSRNVCVFADGEVDRCATGSGVSGRAAIHHAKGELEKGRPITIESILGSELTVEVLEDIDFGSFQAVIPKVSGNAYFTGIQEFWVDPNDPLKDGFILR